MAWVIWYLPRFIILLGAGNDNLNSKYQAAGAIDFLFLLGALIAAVAGVRSAGVTEGEGVLENPFDKLSLFLSRVTMLLVAVLVCVMFYEVVLRYVFEAPTLWANELSLWLAGFVFLFSGLYAMQQRSHIRIFLLYDVLPRWLQKICDSISTALIVIFAIAMVWGSFDEAYSKFLRWETFGTAFDPPIPATMKMLILVVIILVALQAVINLITDWNKGPQHHGIIDETEVEDMINTAQAQGNQGKSG
ncbi:TRAP transporter small permease [Paracoccus methylarcula]|uniref:TRAP transporter small permease protein n=2 Tax=Paracoccus methylarcula TaxID=72022 RepID=A0A422QYW7_9RHOB|nr:TRAP transporter small permease [Paracoccus methylarcula]